MIYEGPHPDEALPVGEESLSLEELDRIIVTAFRVEEIANNQPGDNGIAEVDPETDAWREYTRNRLVDLLIQDTIEHRT